VQSTTSTTYEVVALTALSRFQFEGSLLSSVMAIRAVRLVRQAGWAVRGRKPREWRVSVFDKSDPGAASPSRRRHCNSHACNQVAAAGGSACAVFQPFSREGRARPKLRQIDAGKRRLPLVRAMLPEDCFIWSRAKCDISRLPIEQVARFARNRSSFGSS
jgi:hypothetical protein